jgi:hypothetical protein
MHRVLPGCSYGRIPKVQNALECSSSTEPLLASVLPARSDAASSFGTWRRTAVAALRIGRLDHGAQFRARHHTIHLCQQGGENAWHRRHQGGRWVGAIPLPSRPVGLGRQRSLCAVRRIRAGGKAVNVQRVEWVVQPDPTTAAGSFAKGRGRLARSSLIAAQKAIAEKVPMRALEPCHAFRLGYRSSRQRSGRISGIWRRRRSRCSGGCAGRNGWLRVHDGASHGLNRVFDLSIQMSDVVGFGITDRQAAATRRRVHRCPRAERSLAAAAATHLQPFLGIHPPQFLVVHADLLPLQQQPQPSPAKPPALGSELLQPPHRPHGAGDTHRAAIRVDD